ncbi:MAG TPA: SidA/IucD/PvdA family monooxygenase [Solirubrobacterales bacterium]|jgi:mycobactin lysine-N-oxygenase|nr:SidA/IucD/PvdA family monooxygenase [Solirubrobacterales bacterium]
MSAEHDLIVVGAGAKAAGIATKVHILNGLGLARLSIKVIEGTEVAASWKGRNGMTSGEEPLAVTPIKDVGFPYQSHVEFGEAGEAIDAALAQFTWQQHMISRRRYARWVDAGSPPVRHRDYGEYLTWVLSRATDGVEHLAGRVTEVTLDEEGRRWLVEVEEPGGTSRHAGGALVLTGPGVHRSFPHEPAVASRVFHCDSRRAEFASIPDDRECDIAIVGGGESALSATMFLRGMRPRCRYTIYTPMLPMSRGESFLENRVFSNPDTVEWESLDLQTRRDFVKHSDRGVFDPPSLSAIAYDDRCGFATGRVTDVGAAAGGERVRLDYESPEGTVSREHDFVANCTGFDLLAQLRTLFPAAVRERIERQVGPLWDQPAGTEVPIGRHLELKGMQPRLQIPGLAGLGQGPGFANLGALGLLSNRVLQPAVVDYLTPAKQSHKVAQ